MIEKLFNTAIATYTYLWMLLTSRFQYGTNIYEKDWDILIVLDACRIDAIQEVKDEYDFIYNVDKITSLGSTSPEWIDNTFTEKYIDEIRSTAYVSANAYSERHVGGGDVNRLETAETRGSLFENSDLANHFINNITVGGEFRSFKLVEGATLKETDNRQYFHPDIVTARAIETSRQVSPDKMIVHYMQPHAPYIVDAVERGYYKEYEVNPFKFLKNGGDKSIVWGAYIDNLRLALDSTETLLDNVTADTVAITSDHGELFGELGLYSHIYGMPHPALRKVPWVETTAENNQTSSPEGLISSHNLVSEEDEEVESRLSALGYLS